MTVRDSDTLKGYFNLSKVPVPAYYADLVDTIFAQSTYGPGGVHDHDDRYVELSIANTILAVHTFSPSTYGPPFVLGSNAQGQMVTGLNADQVDGLHTSSNPLGTAAVLATNSSGAFNARYTNGVINVVGFGADPTGVMDSSAAINSALSAAVDGDEVTIPRGTYLLSTPIVITKKIYLRGNGRPLLRLTGGTGAIRVVDTDLVSIRGFAIDLNNVANSIGVHHLGGWWNNYEDIYVEKSTTPVNAYGLVIQSVNSGGGAGSHGSFVGSYRNCTFLRVKIQGADPMKVTTQTFENLDASYLIIDLADATTFIQPVIQQTGGSHFTLSNISGLTCFGGDFEGSGTIYNLGASCQGIHSYNNACSGFSGIYYSGVPAYRCKFEDFGDDLQNYNIVMGNDRPWVVQSHIAVKGSLPSYIIQNAGWNVDHNVGIHYSGDTFHVASNISAISSTQGNLTDVSNGASILTLNTSGQLKYQIASPGTNPRTLTNIFSADGSGTQFALPVDISGNLNFSGSARSITTAASLTVAPTGNVMFNPSGKGLLPTTNYDLNIGSLQNKFLSLHVAELWVETLVAQNTIATIGGRILVGPTTILTSDLSPIATTIFVKHNEMSVDDTVYMEANGNVEFFRVTAGPSGSGPYSYTVTRDLDGTGPNSWLAGDAIFNTGKVNEGFIDLYAISGVASSLQYGPTIAGNVRWTNNPVYYNGWITHWAIGNLTGLYDYDPFNTPVFGAAFGKYDTTTTWMSADATNGIRIMQGNTQIARWFATTSGEFVAGDLLIGQVAAGQDNVVIKNGGISIRTNTTSQISLTTAGIITIGETGASKNNVYISSGALSIRNNTTERVGITAAGILTIKDGAGNAVITLDATTGAEITKKLTMSGANSAISLGSTPPDGKTNGTGVFIDRTGIFGIYANVVQAKLDAATGAFIAGNDAIRVDAGGMTIHDTATSVREIAWWSGGRYLGGIFGDYTSGAEAHMWIRAYHATGDSWSNAVTLLQAYDQVSGNDTRIALTASADGASIDITSDLLTLNGPVIHYEGTLYADRAGAWYELNGFHPTHSFPWVSVPDWWVAAKTTADRRTIDLSTEFGIPAGIKAVAVMLQITDANVGSYITLGPTSAYAAAVVAVSHVANVKSSSSGVVPCDENGDIYFYCDSSIDAVTIQIWGFWM